MTRVASFVLLGLAALGTGTGCGRATTSRNDAPIVTNDGDGQGPRKSKSMEAGIPDPYAQKK
jgi:hypothetical protein